MTDLDNKELGIALDDIVDLAEKTMTFDEFRKLWTGRTFKCMDTDVVFTMPDDVKPREFFPIGNGFIDVGDGFYSRAGGNVIEITGTPSYQITNGESGNGES